LSKAWISTWSTTASSVGGGSSEARVAYEEALLLCENGVERAFLADRLSEVHG
jgi:predicted RNA polymerase sigma factor